ncbi:hypothetical protein, partial [Cellulomonas carbonis]
MSTSGAALPSAAVALAGLGGLGAATVATGLAAGTLVHEGGAPWAAGLAASAAGLAVAGVTTLVRARPLAPRGTSAALAVSAGTWWLVGTPTVPGAGGGAVAPSAADAAL